ncbi:MAG: UDP-N-acetylmuramate dehydrogenase [Acidobacteriaceae bacterium]
MMAKLNIREGVELAPFTTFGIGGPARYFVQAENEVQVAAAVAWAKERELRLFVLGGGSNLLVRDDGFDGLVLKVVVMGVEACGEGRYEVGAGESWDRFVEMMMWVGMAGVECLAGIPGSVGGTPVQNVGAYGQEVSESIEWVRAYDLRTESWVKLSKQECRFRYRESVFNTDEPGRYIVTRVRFRLTEGGEPNLRYADLQKRLGGRTELTLLDVATAVREIRREKGMLLVQGDPDCRSAGSFFKNPIVASERLKEIAAAVGVEESAVPHWPAGEGRTKIPAAWLLEKTGFVKGYGEGAARISTKHTLALTNRGGATCADVEGLQAEIMRGVQERFGIALQREPVLVS